MLKIWGRRNSGNVIKVLWCLDEVGVPFELEELGGTFGGNREPWFLERNPNGLVPTIDDEGYVLWESNVIVRYLAARYSPGGLWPEDARARADADRWMDWPMLVQPFMTTLNVGLTRTPPEQRNHAELEAAREDAARVWAVLDGHLAGRDFVAGASFTMGDIAVGNLAYRWFNLDLERPDMANLQAWYLRLTERSAFSAQVMRPLG